MIFICIEHMNQSQNSLKIPNECIECLLRVLKNYIVYVRKDSFNYNKIRIYL